MFEVTPLSTNQNKAVGELTDLELVQALAERSLINHQSWHHLKGNRQAQAQQHVTSALMFLLKEQPQEALEYLQQAVNWLDGSLKAPACADHPRQKS
ncbi:MAG: DUF6439 family protein [Cyanobacteria bacterium J06621_8]